MATRRADRMGWIEYARAFGAVGVLVIHVLASVFAVSECEQQRMAAYSVISIVLGRWAVPGFFMITGYLLLNPAKEVGWRQARRYSLRMAKVIATFGLVFSLIKEGWTSYSEGTLSISVLPRAIVDTLTASSLEHLWYVYALMLVYLLVPPLRLLGKKLGPTGFCAFTAVLFVGVLVVPTCIKTWELIQGADMEIVQVGLVALINNTAIGATCVCVGGCMHYLKLRPWVVVAGIASLATMLGISQWGVWNEYSDMGVVFLQGSCFACLYALMVLMLLRDRLGNVAVEQGSIVDELARDSFGIYVLHPLFLHVFLLFVGPYMLPPVILEALLLVAALVCSVAATRIVRKLPLVGGLL